MQKVKNFTNDDCTAKNTNKNEKKIFKLTKQKNKTSVFGVSND